MTSATKRHLNYTQRQRITRDHITLEIRRSPDGPRLSATVDLESYDLDPTARVVVEAYRTSVMERVELGAVSDRNGLENHLLQSFSGGESLLCRVKVISTPSSGRHGLLLAVADKLRPESEYDDEGGRSLLPFREDDSLGQRIWRLDLSGDSPVVLINPQIGDWRDYARRPTFTSVVLPEVLGRVCRWIVRNPTPDDEESPSNEWRSFLADLGADFGEADPEMEEDSLDVWVDDVVALFCSRHQFRDRLLEQVEGGET